jgi:hypothetical protein
VRGAGSEPAQTVRGAVGVVGGCWKESTSRELVTEGACLLAEFAPSVVFRIRRKKTKPR